MVKQFLKKKSKRVSTRKRTKIERKVREHNKKLRKNSKGKPKIGKRKDIGVPNSLPFKAEILREAQKRKEQAEAEKAKQKQRLKSARANEVAKKRGIEALVKDVHKKTAEYEKRVQFTKKVDSGRPVEQSMKTFYREFQKVIAEADVILQVLDARDPLGTRCPQVEQAVLEAGSTKRLVLVLNKIDLIPPENAEAWLKYLRNEFPTVAIKCSTQKQNTKLSHTSRKVLDGRPKPSKTSGSVGIENLLKLLGSYCRNKNLKQAITVGAVGFPNTGKSSLVNTLKRGKACNVGSTPGVTRSVQAVQIDQHVKLLDSPGIVMASGKSDSSLILRNCVKIESLDDPLPAVEAILRRCNKQELMVRYCLPNFNDSQEFLLVLAQRMGKLRKGGVPDGVKAAKMLLQDWNRGKIAYYSQPPESHTLPTHINATVVKEMAQEFDIDSLVAEERAYLQELRKPAVAPMAVESVGFGEGKVGDEDEDESMVDEDEDDSDAGYEDEEDDDDEPPMLVEAMDENEDNLEGSSDEELKNVQVSLKPRAQKRQKKIQRKKNRRLSRKSL